MKQPSIFKQLYFSVAALLLLLFFLAAALVYINISMQLNRSKDADLVNSSRAFWDSLQHAGTDSTEKLKQAYRNSLPPDAEMRSFRVWKDHSLIFQAGNAQLKDAPEAKPEFSEKKLGKDTWRTYAFYVNEENVIIEVSENLISRERLIYGIFKGFLESSLLLLPLLALLLFYALRLCLRGLTHMEQVLAKRGPQSLETLDVENIPNELRPLQKAINFLLGKLQSTLSQERQLIDNAAHELRTPLATLKLHAQLAEDAANEHDRKESIKDLVATIDRTTSMLDQLLALSRLATEQPVKSPVRLYGAAIQAVRDYTAAAEAKQIALRLDGDRAAEAYTHEELLRILLGVLLDNAVKYTPRGGEIRINVRKDTIDIADSGPGIPENEREKVFERFYRGKQGVRGNGLGLSIARQIGELLNIQITLGDAPEAGGLLVRLFFLKET